MTAESSQVLECAGGRVLIRVNSDNTPGLITAQRVSDFVEEKKIKFVGDPVVVAEGEGGVRVNDSLDTGIWRGGSLEGTIVGGTVKACRGCNGKGPDAPCSLKLLDGILST